MNILDKMVYDILSNQNYLYLIQIILCLYIVIIIPKFSLVFYNLFKSCIFRSMIILLIYYISYYNMNISLLLVISLFLSIERVNRIDKLNNV